MNLRGLIRERFEKIISEEIHVDIIGDQDVTLNEEKIGEVELFNRHNKYLVLDKIFI